MRTRTATFLLARVVVILLPLLAAEAPRSSEAQEPKKVARVGVLTMGGPASAGAVNVEAFRRGMTDLGYVEGKNVVYEWRYADNRSERIPELVADLIGLKVDVIFTPASNGAVVAKQLTTTIPIVMVGVDDPVGMGLISSLAHPGGNVTGLAANSTELSSKRLQLLREAVPMLGRVAVLWNSTSRAMSLRFQEIQAAAPTLRLTLQSVPVRGTGDFTGAFAEMTRQRPDAMIVFVGPIGPNDLPRVVEFAARQRIPTMYEFRQHVDAGGLMSYGINYPELARRAATYVDKILNGRKPADLPVEEPARLELVINLKAAKALGLTIPPSFLGRADQVIE